MYHVPTLHVHGSVTNRHVSWQEQSWRRGGGVLGRGQGCISGGGGVARTALAPSCTRYASCWTSWIPAPIVIVDLGH